MAAVKLAVLCVVLAVGQAAILHNNDVLHHETPHDKDSLRESIRNIAERLDRWDSLFVGRLEPRMAGAATSLANLDSNIRNLQERAHIWDTFQLHVSAWNDQIKALDHKMNIINEGYSKLTSLDTELSTVLHPNGTLFLIMGKLAELNARVDGLVAGLHRDPAPVVGDFATRGLLHTVRALEKKITTVQSTLDQLLQRPDSVEGRETMDESREEVKKCGGSSTVEDMLRDVSAKVDSIYDKNEEVSLEVRHPGSRCRKLVAPYRKLVGDVEYLRGVVQDLVADGSEGEKAALRRGRSRVPMLAEIKDELEDIERRIVQLGRSQDRNVNENERILRRIDRKIDELAKDDDLEELVEKEFKKIRKQLNKIEDNDDSNDDDDDSDEDKKSKRRRKDDTDEDDTDEDDNGSDDDEKNKRRRKEDTDEDDTDEDDNDSDDDKKRKRNKKNDTDEDDDDDDDSDEDKKSKRRRKNDTDEDDTEEDDDSDDDKKSKRRRKNDTEDDSDEDDKKNKKRKKNTNEDDSDDDDDDSNDDNDSKHDKKRKHGSKDDNDDDTDEDDHDSNELKRGKNDTDEVN